MYVSSSRWLGLAVHTTTAAMPLGRAGRGRAVMVLAFCSTGFTIGTISYSFGVFVEPISDEFGWTRTEINVAVTLSYLVYSALGPVVGWAIDTHGPRLVSTVSLALVGCACSPPPPRRRPPA